MFEDYDPKRHNKDVQLYEIIPVYVGDNIAYTLQAVDIATDVAALVPWYYMVKVDG